MGKFFLVLVFIFTLLFVGFYLASNSLLTRVSNKGLAHLVQNANKFGVEISNAKFTEVKWNPLRTVVWRGFSVDVKAVQKNGFSTTHEFNLNVDEAALRLNSFRDRKFVLVARGLSAIFHRPSAGIPGISEEQTDRVDTGHLEIPFQLDFLDPKTAASESRVLIEGLTELITKGKTPMPIQFSATSNITIKGKSFKADLAIKQEGNQFLLVMDKEDIRLIAEELTKGTKEKLTESEIELVSQHPLLAQGLLMIQDYAQNVANQAHRVNPDIPEDAYRHTLWSYLLTKTYGADFAKVVTDAHEISDSKESEADHRMDYNNNSVGRRYALAGYSESSILDRVMSDSDVILSKHDA